MPCVHNREDPYETSPGAMAAMLCRACALLEENGLYDKMPQSIKSWYEPHKIFDKKREKLEAEIDFESVLKLCPPNGPLGMADEDLIKFFERQ